MRITNKIMQNNNLSNINTNKIMQDQLSTQMSTQKKVSKPSDDPVVAIRALRLRSNVTEVSQYYSKNIPDAESWLEVTEDALKNLSSVLTDVIKQCTKGANGDLTSEDRQIILEQLKALGEEVYSTGDADYAGRYVFTGYRTDTSLKFDGTDLVDGKIELPYTITQQIDNTAISKVTHVNTMAGDDNVLDMNSQNYAGKNIAEIDVTSKDYYRIRLAYKECADTVPSLQYAVKNADGDIEFEDINVQVVHNTANPDAYKQLDQMTGEGAIFIPETGELLLSADAYDKLMNVNDDAITSEKNEGEIRITYDKKEWAKGDLRPEHYFACTAEKDGELIDYNMKLLEGEKDIQSIEYDVGFNQTIRVNSVADECFSHDIGREIDDLVEAMQGVVEAEKVVKDLEGAYKSATEDEKKIMSPKLDAAKKALSLLKEKSQRMFEKGITSAQGFLDETNLSITNCGTRSSKLDLVKNRMQTQKTTFETIKSENEDIDITEVAIQLSSAQLTYEAALMATGKVAQTSLLNYI